MTKKYSTNLFFFFLIAIFAVSAKAETPNLNCTCPVYDPYAMDLNAEYGDTNCKAIGPVEYAYMPPDPNCGIIGPIRYAYILSASGWRWESPSYLLVDYLAAGYPVISMAPNPGDTFYGYQVYYYYFRNPNAVCPEGRWELKCCIQLTDYLAQGYPLIAKKLPTGPWAGSTYYGQTVYWFYFQSLNYTYACCEDNDGDGHYAINSNCQQSDDCNDNDTAIHPDAIEICDGIDNNCNGLIDDTCFGEDNKCYSEPNSTEIGSSANFASGNLYHNQTILQTPNSGLQNYFVISYNSLDTIAGALGRGWTHNYRTNITDNGNTLVFREADGRIVHYQSTGSNNYSPDASSGRHTVITKNPDGSYIMTEKSGIKHNFDSEGRLTGITDRNNNMLSLSYTGYDLTLITDSSSRQTILAYDADHKITSITDSAGRATVFMYNGEFLISVTDPAGGTWTYAYDANGRMFTKTDPRWHTTFYTYDANGKIISSLNAEGNIKTIAYNQTNRSAIVTEKNGRQIIYAYDNTLNVPLQITDANANQTIYQYDSNRNLLSKTEPDGKTTSYTYDTNGNMLSETDAIGNTTSYTYNSFGQALTKADPDGNITSFIYDLNGNLLQKVDALNNTTTYIYGTKGEKFSETDPKGNTTIYTYDLYGNLSSVANTLNQTIAYTYDISGNMLSITGANGNTATYEYDFNNRLIKEIQPEGGIINYEYDLAGNKTASTDAIGNRTSFTYDSLNRLTELRTQNSERTTYAYDAEGNMTSMTIKDSNGSIMTSESYTYNAYNRLIQTTHADGTYTEQDYDIHENIVSKKDENGNITTYAYDAINRLASVTDPAGGATAYTYDKRGNLKSVTDADGNKTLYNYDSLNRLISTTSSDTGTTAYIYDSNGNMTAKTDANGVTTTYAYDSLNHLTELRTPNAELTTYAYDNCSNGIGKVCIMTDPSGTTWYDYDKAGRVIRETKEISGLIYRTEYAYDSNGNVLTVTYPGGRIVTYEYNQLNKVTSVTEILNGVARTLASNIVYIPFGDITSMQQGNGIITTKVYDSRYQLNTLDIGTLKQLSYTKDGTGNITAVADNLNPAKTKAYTYDILNRLQTANGTWGILNYTYDSVGNRLTETQNVNSTSYSYTANKLTSSTGAKTFNFSYDSNGDTVSENTRQFIYNQNQRLTRVTDTGTILEEYIYNGNGQRVKKFTQNNSQCSIFHYDQNGLLIAESTGTGAITAEYIYLNGKPLAKIAGNNVYYYHNDHLGTPMMITDENQNTVWEGEFLPFGEPVTVTGSITNNLRFPGQYYDAETGLHQNWHRDYKPEIGRYLEFDPLLKRFNYTEKATCRQSMIHLPLEEPKKLNPFIYTDNNPLNLIDPKGLACGSGWTQAIVPDNWFRQYSFTKSCRAHDNCYGCKGLMEEKSQSDCDKDFLYALLAVCAGLQKNTYWQNHCEGAAYNYYYYVAKNGKPYFNAARKKCSCKK